MPQGKVKWFNKEKGWGFIEYKGDDYFVHYKEITGVGFKTLVPEQEVDFEAAIRPRGKIALNVKILVN